MLNFLIFIFILSILIISHELGHFIAAKMSGVKVEKFSIGFGPALAKFKGKETTFLICVIPLGGYVKLAGDSRTEHKGEKYEFLSQPVGVKAKIVFWGPLFNYLLAFLVFWIVFINGFPYFTTKVGKVMEGYPAQQAGIEEEDLILKVNGRKVEIWEELQRMIRQSKGKISFTILRKGEVKEVELVPRKEKIRDIFDREREFPVVGITPSTETKVVKEKVFPAFLKAGKRLIYLSWVIIQGIFFTVTGMIPFREAVTGPVGIYYITQQTVELGMVALLNLIGVLNVTLAVVNLLPLPVLDGGHLFFFLIEKIRGRPLSEKWENIITQIGIAIIIAIAIFVFYNDIIRFGPKIFLGK